MRDKVSIFPPTRRCIKNVVEKNLLWYEQVFCWLVSYNGLRCTHKVNWNKNSFPCFWFSWQLTETISRNDCFSRRLRMLSQRKKVGLLLFIILVILPLTSVLADDWPNTHVNTGENPGDLLAVARSQVGYSEQSLGFTKYGLWFEQTYNYPLFQYGEWCAMFVSCVLIRRDSRELFPFLHGTRRGCLLSWHEGSMSPPAIRPGRWSDLFLLGHVGIVSSYADGRIKTIEGNVAETLERQTQ